MVLYVIIFLVVAVIAVFTWAHYQAEKDEQKLLQEDPGALYPFFGVFTERLKYTTSAYAKDVILSNTDTGYIYIGGKIYDMADIASCRAETLGGHTTTSYHDIQTISTNTGEAIGRAIVGGVVGGDVGALIGASTASREIKTKTVAKNHYTPKFQCLILEFTNDSPFVSTVTTNSLGEMDKVVNFIHSEISCYKNKLKERKIKVEGNIAAFIKSPTDFTFNQIKELDPNVITSLKDSLLLSQETTKKCANCLGLFVLQHVKISSESVTFSSLSKDFQNVKEDAIKMKEYLIEKFGSPVEDKDFSTLTTDIKANSVRLNWKRSKASLFFHFNKGINQYGCIIELFNTKAIEERRERENNAPIPYEFLQNEDEFKKFMDSPLDYPTYQLENMDPECYNSSETGYILSKNACKMCAKVGGLVSLRNIFLDYEEVILSSSSKNFELIKNDAIKYKKFLNDKYGDADVEQDITSLDSEKANKGILLKWSNVCSFFLYYKEDEENYSCRISLKRPKRKKMEKRTSVI